MRLKALVFGDIRFQFKYGFYFIYLVLTLLYIAALSALPKEWRQTAGLLMIFSDPAAMGLFFMGAIVLFEKSERVLDSLAVSPVKPVEYVLSKLVSIALISTLAALVIGLTAGGIKHPTTFLAGVFFCSCLFSAVGLMVASRSATLNGFILATVPAELVINIPAVLWLFGFRPGWLILHPGVSMMMLCSGTGNLPLALLILLAWTGLFTVITVRTITKMFSGVGGVKL